jgi:hypothetical protein
MMYSGAGLLALAIAMFVVSYIVDTDLEKAVKNTRSIAEVVNDRDWQRLRSLLDQGTSLGTVYNDRDQIVGGAQQTAERIGVKNVRIIGLEATQDGTLITVNVDCISEQELYPGTTPTSWRFTYENFGDGWKLTRIEPLANRIITPEVIQRHLARPQ